MACFSVQAREKNVHVLEQFVKHGADFSHGFFHAPSMRSCTGLFSHGDVILQQKLEKQGRHILSRVIYAKLSTTTQLCRIYVGRMEIRCGTALPQTSRQAYVVAAKSALKGTFIRQTIFESNSICT